MREKIPNALSISRILLAICIILTASQLGFRTYIATVCMLVIAAGTDALDGHLARRWKTTSDVGYVLDTMGDRAVHLALTLVFLFRYSFHPLFAWLLIFRDIGIYAVRVLSKNWLQKSKEMRPIFLLHTTLLRIWLGLFIVRDGVRVFTGSDYLGIALFEVGQLTLLCVTIIISYFGLFRSFSWLVDIDHTSLK